MSDDRPPTSRDLLNIVNEALNRRPPLWRRVVEFLRRSRARLATNGGYWGGVTMHGLRRAGARAAAFLRGTGGDRG